MDPSFFKYNRNLVAQHVRDGIVVLHSGVKKQVSSQEGYDFRPNKMFYYLTGLSHPGLILILMVQESQVKEFLFIPKPDPLKEAWEGKQLDKQWAKRVSEIEYICDISNVKETWGDILQKHQSSYLWLNTKDHQTHELQTYFDLVFDEKRVKCIHDYLSLLRIRKTTLEIKKVENASQVAALGVKEVIKNARPGVYEYQLEAVHDFVMKSNGIKPGQFKTILASGKNTTILHYLDNDSLIDDGDLILMDIDVEVDHYHCDFTRVFPANGRFSPRQHEVYSAVLKVQKELISILKPGLRFSELNQLAEKLLTYACKQLALPGNLKNYYFHRIGHPIGLDTHDVGHTEDMVLNEGMVITIEPGLYITEERIGVRIEDIMAITRTGSRNLTAHMEKEIEDIEQLMARKGSGIVDQYS